MSQPSPHNAKTTVTAKSLVETRPHARQFNLTSIKKASSAISGLHDSRFRGRGMDYQESRIYQNGDDIRNMDWRVTARTGIAHTKLFQEERERPTYLVVDANDSMRFGTKKQFKSVLASKVAALLGWSSVQQGDRIGIMSFGSNGLHIGKATAGKRGMMGVISHLIKAFDSVGKNQEHHPLDQALKQLRTIIRPGSLVIIVSDFQTLGDESKRHLLQLRKHNDVLAVKVSDPFENQLPLPALYGVQTSQRAKVLNTQLDRTQKAMRERQSRHIQALKDNIIKAGVPLIPIQTSDNWVSTLKNGLTNPALAFSHWLGANG
ncbi:DUF58 domain-containing protein [Marinicella sp. S1101]|uniref:DUF58 domain-containing protein n=1 Tax=Marinicella marina TaxID=2996016 RepID=UPI0022608626|nr:DUF58 domain-containing protein [Marinicella marina]MCX7554305.1 DUF58 domain-containing protein [Marinicella marina]MDJ1138704.1 DUF58 domain-containing protein [Marinicella marina]